MEITFNYITTNKINGKQYVGTHTTKDINDKYLGSGTYIIRAIKKYGSENFIREIICYTSKENANHNEEYFIQTYNTLAPNGYNLSPTGGLRYGGRHSEDAKRRIGEKNRIHALNKKLGPRSLKTNISVYLRKYGNNSTEINITPCKTCGEPVVNANKEYCNTRCVNLYRTKTNTWKGKKGKRKLSFTDIKRIYEDQNLETLCKELKVSPHTLRACLKEYGFEGFKDFVRNFSKDKDIY